MMYAGMVYARPNCETKGNWFHFKMGIADGYRCFQCNTWVYVNQKMKCLCDRETTDEKVAEKPVIS